VSGKDSMKNDFLGRSRFGKDIKISVPPTVLVTAMAKVPDVTKTVTSDFKAVGDGVYLLGASRREIGGSELEDAFELPSSVRRTAPPVDGEENHRLYRTMHQAIQKGLLRSAHDCSEGGLLVALAESCIGGMVGLSAEIESWAESLKEFGGTMAEFFFNETPGRFVVSVAPEKEEEFRKFFSGLQCLKIGKVSPDILRFTRQGLVILDVPVREARRAWRGEK
jgi:phosphoribosylformylglycinamidine synthase